VFKYKLLQSLAICSLAAGCTELRNANYDYSYVNEMGAFLTRSEIPGTLYIMTISDGSANIYAADNGDIPIPDGSLRTSGTADISNSKIVGASATLIKAGKAQVSGSMEFEGKIIANNTQTESVSAAKAASLIENHYARLVSEQGGIAGPGHEPLEARNVIENKNAYYVLISGQAKADDLTLSFAPPEGHENGISVTFGDTEFTDLKIRNQALYTCKKNGENDRASCAVTAHVLDAKWSQTDGVSKLNVYPARIGSASVPRSIVSAALRSRN
jgi:hypothetical protein